jgi:hypothetical protein
VAVNNSKHGERLSVCFYAVARFLLRLPKAHVNRYVAEYHIGQDYVKGFNRVAVVFVAVDLKLVVFIREEGLR